MLVFAVIYSLNAILAFVGNLFVVLVVILYRNFHNMRYLLLASLALSDLLIAIVVSNRAVATAAEEWIFGTTWCHGASYTIRVGHLSTVFHLCAVSYERYDAIVRRPLTYSSRITIKRALLNMAILWILPAVISLGPFIGWGDFVYNPDVFACEQKWDGQTAIPLLITTFVLPLGAIFFLNYKVLKVVLRIQNSVEILNKSLPNPENKTPDDPNQHHECSTENQQEDHFRRHPKQQEEQAEIGNGEHRVEATGQIQNIIHQSTLLNHSNEVKGEENATYQAEPVERIETIDQEEVVCGSGSTPCGPASNIRPDKGNQQAFCQDEGGRLKQNCEKRILKSKEVQIHLSTDENQSTLQSRYGILEDNSGLQGERVCEVQTPKERRDCIQQSSSDQIITEDANGKEGMEEANGSQSERPFQVEVQKRYSRRVKIKPTFETHTVDKYVLTEAQARRMNSGEENCVILSFSQVPSQDNHSEDLRNPEIIESLPQGDSSQPHENHAQDQPRPPGKTQMRLAKLLIEGKAARDVMIIIGAFILCYLPMWIMWMYRAAGGRLSVEAILFIHWVYALSTFSNAIIYPIRKREFRRALRKLLKL